MLLDNRSVYRLLESNTADLTEPIERKTAHGEFGGATLPT